MPRLELTSAQYGENIQLRCDACGWNGTARDASERQCREFVAVRCPSCDRTIARVLPDSPKPSDETATFSDFDGTELTCKSCGWSGPGREWSTETSSGMELFDVYCPKCDWREGFRSFPTHGQIRDAAEAGDPRAIAELPALDRVEASLERAAGSLLRDPAELPDLEGDELELLWDLESGGKPGEAETIIRHGERELWRETAFWEGGDRFAQVFTILRRRYGWRLVSLKPTDASLGYLGGDRFTYDYRRAELGLTNLDPVDGGLVHTFGGASIRAAGTAELALGHVIDGRGLRFHVLRQGELVVWRAPKPGGEPTSADAERLAEWVSSKYRESVRVIREG